MTTTTHPMADKPIGQLLRQFAVPSIIAMLVSSLYNIIDQLFIGQNIGLLGNAATNIAFPLTPTCVAFSLMFGIGGAARFNLAMGAGRKKEAAAYMGNALLMLVSCGIVLCIIVRLFLTPMLLFFGATDQVLDYARTYTGITSLGFPFLILATGGGHLIRADGSPQFSMICNLVGAIVNTVLDALFIFGFHMGISGAAIATVCGQICGALLAFAFNIKVNTDINLNMKGFRPNKKIIGTIYSVGVPSIVMQAIGSVMTFGMNKILIQFTSTATAVFGVYFKLNSFIFMPIFGLNNGMVPIVAYNYGAKNKKRITHTIRLSIVSAICIMLFGLALFMIFPAQLLSLFNASGSMLEIGVPALRIICLSFTFAGFCIVVGSVFQALGNGVYSLIISVTRQLLIILPVAALLAKLGGLSAVWWAIPIAEIASVLLSAFFFRKIYKEKIAPLGKA